MMTAPAPISVPIRARSLDVARLLLMSQATSVVPLLNELEAAMPDLSVADLKSGWALSEMLRNDPGRIQMPTVGLPSVHEDPVGWLTALIGLLYEPARGCA